MKNKKIIWKDKTNPELFRLISIVSLLFGLSFMILIPDLKYKILGIIFIIFLIYEIFIIYKRKLNYITNNGIVIGNITSYKRSSFDPNQISKLIYWNDINNLLIFGKVQKTRIGLLWDYLQLIKKDGKKYECLIYDPKGFVDTLKKINQYHLLSKDSKFR